MKINGNEIRPGNVIEHKGGLWIAVKTQAVKPGNDMPNLHLTQDQITALVTYLEGLK